MGTLPRRTPKRLPEKLREIRLKLGLSQNGMIRRMGLAEEMTREEVSSFELGRRQPNLIVLWAYANAANVYVDALILDAIDLPEELPSQVKSEGVLRTTAGRRGRKKG